jgi:hypothetical protein
VTERIVNTLEVIEVQQQDGKPFSPPALARGSLFDLSRVDEQFDTALLSRRANGPITGKSPGFAPLEIGPIHQPRLRGATSFSCFLWSNEIG